MRQRRSQMSLYDQPDYVLHIDGQELINKGKREQGFKLIKKAASNGYPSAIASVNWYLILDGQFKEAIKLTQEFLPKAFTWIDEEESRLNGTWGIKKEQKNNVIQHAFYEISNLKSNVAVAYLALGQEETALELWEEAATNHNHLEARFYPIFHEGQKSPELMLRLLTKEFQKEELQTLVSTMVDISSEGKGWFAKWAQDGLKILQQAAKKSKYKNAPSSVGNVAASGAVTFGAGYAASRAAREYIQNQSQDSIEAGEGAFDWIGDLFN